jgi:hypothetical protein
LVYEIGSHLNRDPLRTRGLKEGAARAVEKQSPQEESPRKNITSRHLKKK